MTRYDIAQYAYHAVFLIVAILCYGWEIWQRTPWLLLQQRPRNMMNRLSQWRSDDDDQKTSATFNQASKDRRSSKVNSERRDQPDEAVNNTLEGGGLPSKPGKAGNPITEWFSPWLRWMAILPGIIWLPSIVLALLQLYHSGLDNTLLVKSTSEWNTSALCEEISRIPKATDLCDESLPTRVDADIGGEGIRAGVYIPVGLALLALIQGSFHTADSGIKEIGTTQLLTLFYLNFNAAKAAGTTPSFSDLTFPEVVIVCMCIDLTAAGLHMTTSGKESLAARWFIYMAAVMHSWAIAMLIAMLAHIQGNYTNLPAASIIWWGRIDSYTGPSKTVWIYVTARCCIFAHGLWLDCRHTKDFHVIERQWSSLLASGDQDAEKQKGIQSKFDYGALRAAVFSKWIEYIPSILVAAASIETLVKRQLQFQSDITEWGQSAALVIAIAGTLHWIFVIVNVRIEARQSSRQSAQQRSSVIEFSKRVLSDSGGPPQENAVLKRPVNYPRFASAWDPLRRVSNEYLISAAKEFDKGAIRYALEHGADKDYVDPATGMTALLYAVERDNLAFFKELVFVSNASTDAGATSALFFAAQKGAVGILTYLLETDLNALMSCDEKGRTALWYAAKHGQIGAVESLLVKIDKLHFGSSSKEHQVPAVNLPFISFSASCGKRVQCKTLISGPRDPPHQTPLFVAAEQGFSKIAQRLLNSPAQLDSLPQVREILKAAAERKNVSALECLLACDSTSLQLDDDDSSLLHIALRDRTSLDHLMFLAAVFRGSPKTIDVRDRFGHTALWIAVDNNDRNAIAILIDNGADPFAEHLIDTTIRTPMSIAVNRTPLSPFDPRGMYPLLGVVFPALAGGTRLRSLNFTDKFIRGLSEMSRKELSNLADMKCILPTDSFGNDEIPLILYALDHPSSDLLLALTECPAKEWRGLEAHVMNFQTLQRSRTDDSHWTRITFSDWLTLKISSVSTEDRELFFLNIAQRTELPRE
ncbi:Ankyrin-like [Pseudocercospora fuligena]|uniref:Ankyrin-like n=1 Tax=Pseudocercospora fuligena TaxID=685502 RepID=A0A8H6RMX0_9PEZI|nr:Ankyrin-like [Pseudocercospora fuligena]